MSRRGPLIAIGGHEDKEEDREILCEVANRVKGGRLVVATVASSIPDEYFVEYDRVFRELGVEDIVELYVKERSEAFDPEKAEALEGAAGVFFTGGDQLRIASQIGDTMVEAAIRTVWEDGGVIAGTSAGASVMSDVMLIGGPSSESHRIGALHMSAGLGLISNVVVDQHFAERGRIGRLLGAVSLNPRILGIGIDENTACIIDGSEMRIIGAGAVYVADAADVSHSNLAEAEPNSVLSVFDMKLHVLSSGDRFDLDRRTPTAGPHTSPPKARKD